jgi:hypothetical protein
VLVEDCDMVRKWRKLFFASLKERVVLNIEKHENHENHEKGSCLLLCGKNENSFVASLKSA